MNIELTAIEAGSLVLFTLGVVGVGMALRIRASRKKKRDVKKDKDWKESKAKVTEQDEFKTNPETSAQEKVQKPQEQSEPSQETAQTKNIDTDALLDDLKKDSGKE